MTDKRKPRAEARGRDGWPELEQRPQAGPQTVYHKKGNPCQSLTGQERELLRLVADKDSETIRRLTIGLELFNELSRSISPEAGGRMDRQEQVTQIMRLAASGNIDQARQLVDDIKARFLLSQVFGPELDLGRSMGR